MSSAADHINQIPLEEKLKEIEEKIQKADSMEEIDIYSFYFEKGKAYKEHGKTEEAVKEFKFVIEKTQSFNLKMDSVFEILLIAIRSKDLPMIKENLDLCKKFLKDASDWEKKNKFKVYEGLYFILTRKFAEAGKLFLDALMTFTNYELFPYKDFVFYTAITNIITVDRVTLKNRVIDNSDVISCIKEIPHLKEFLESLYNGDYKKFFVEFYHIITKIQNDFFLSKHSNYFISEMRIKVYNQFLQSYKTVTISNMAESFGVSYKFIEKEMFNFIAQGKISAKIDSVSNIIECTQNEPTVDLYHRTLRESDILLNKIHKLSKLLEL